ncbi:hypothetical protein EVAR_78115_1 [Eumeta japonica]|uniref:Uncharacterized protein n=1 Tax=Eumeta variegata TaxID=151549 RepID=A0A4C1T1E1_EUMVA|nr:hypothetical protein EVAR_78115_1 [Eumeta japonica]
MGQEKGGVAAACASRSLRLNYFILFFTLVTTPSIKPHYSPTSRFLYLSLKDTPHVPPINGAPTPLILLNIVSQQPETSGLEDVLAVRRRPAPRRTLSRQRRLGAAEGRLVRRSD